MHNHFSQSGRLSQAFLEGRGPANKADRAYILAHYGEPGLPDGIQASIEKGIAGEVAPEGRAQGWRLPELREPSGNPQNDLSDAVALMDILEAVGGSMPLADALAEFEGRGLSEDEFSRACGLVAIIHYMDDGVCYLSVTANVMRPGEALRVLVESRATRKGGR